MKLLVFLAKGFETIEFSAFIDVMGWAKTDFAVTLGEDVLSNIPMGHPLTYRDVGTKI